MALNQKGQSLAEFALTLPLWLLLVTGLIQLAFLTQASFFARHAVQEAARVYAVRGAASPQRALRAAKRAVDISLKSCRPKPSYQLTLLNEGSHSIYRQPRSDIKDRPYLIQMQLNLEYPLLFRFPGFGSNAHLSALAAVQNEHTLDYDLTHP